MGLPHFSPFLYKASATQVISDFGSIETKLHTTHLFILV